MLSQSRIIIALTCSIFFRMCSAIDYIPKDDRIVSLPGQSPVNFQQYAGYITVDKKQQRALFYYLVEAESKPDSKPLVLWLNGGPGCSSLGAGAFSEHGPFRPSGGETLIRNEYSWNKEANMLYLESPAGVGFSYSANKSFYASVNDTITAQDNLVFLEQWFLKYPEYKNRDFYITGESYAGHYVPQLAQLIVMSGFKINLKGIAVGNALLEFNTDLNSEGDFYWTHGLISDSTYKLLSSICNTSQIWRERITGSSSAACTKINKILSKEIPDSLDFYDVTLDSCSSSGNPQLEAMNHPLVRQRMDRSRSATPNQAKGSENIDLCLQEKTFDYLNRDAVQEALHAQLLGVKVWGFCSGVIKYEMRNLEIPTIDVVGWLVSSGIRVLVFSGDQDSVVPFTGSRSLVDGLAKQLGLKVTVPYRAWFTNKQIAGWTQVYGDVLTFATVRGAGHLVPFTSPKKALALFAAFLAGKPLPHA